MNSDHNLVSLLEEVYQPSDSTLRWGMQTQFASINGPGNCPLMRITFFTTPSGLIVDRVTVKSYTLVTPVVGGKSGFVFFTVLGPQGKPWGSGLFVRKSGSMGADRVP